MQFVLSCKLQDVLKGPNQKPVNGYTLPLSYSPFSNCTRSLNTSDHFTPGVWHSQLYNNKLNLLCFVVVPQLQYLPPYHILPTF